MSSVRLYARVFLGFAALALLTVVSALTIGCGGGYSAPPAIVVTIASGSGTPIALAAGGTHTFTVTVANDPNSAGVNWSASVGTITATGVYTAPSPVSTTTAIITATSKTDPTQSGTFTVTLTPIAVAGATTPVAMVAGGTQTFNVTITGDTTLSQGVTWSITSGGGSLSGGTATSVIYTAPSPVITGTAVITATSKTDPTKSYTFTVTLTPIVVNITTTPVAMVAGATQTFAASVSNDITPSAGVTWSASVGSITSAGVYTAPTPVATATATITATSKTDPSKTATVSVPLTPIAVTIPTPPTAIAGAGTEAIAATVTGDATANAGVTWSITSGGGALSAVTTTSVTYTAPLPVTTTTAVITATSKTDTSKTATFTIPLTPISVGAISPATVNLGTTTTQAFTGAAVSNDSSNSGVTWSISPATGAGTIVSTTGAYTAPTTVISAATTVTVTATSVKDPTKTATATITLNPISVGTVSPAAVTLNGGGAQAFTGAALTYDGSNSGVTWSISPATGAGSIVSTTGAYTAPAVVGGTSPVTVTVTATSVKDTSKTSTATITLNPIAISFTTTTTGITLDSGQTLALAAALTNDGSASGASFATTGAGTVSPSSATGNTPSTTLTATGTTASNVTVTATSIKDTTKTATTASITVNPVLAITAGALTAGTTNTAYPGATIVASGGTGTKTFALASGSLPPGLTLSSTGAISGTITGGANTYTFTVKVTDTATTPGTVTSGTYTIAITATPLAWTNPSAPVTLPAATVGTAVPAVSLATSGGTGAVSYSLNSGTLPTGLSLNGATGVVSGTPTQPTPTTGNVVTFKVTDSATPTPATSISPAVTIIVNPVTLVVNTPTLPTGFVNTAYGSAGYQFTSTGGTGAITWTMSPTTVDGLTLTTSGLLTGTPTATFGPATISVTATDSATNQQQTKTITPSLTVSNALTITTNQSTLPIAYTGIAYTPTTLAASGGSGSGYTWIVTSGLTGSNSLAAINLAVSSAGVITGTPSTTGTANFTVQVTDSASHTATQSYTITAYTPLSLPTPNPNSLGSATTSAGYTGSIVASGGVSPYTWNVNGTNAITNSVTLGNGTMQAASNGNILNITGTPTTTGTISFAVKITDNTGTVVGPTTYTIAVSANYSISGNINLTNNCGSIPVPSMTATLTQGANTIQTVAATGGTYSFANVPNGTYTVTLSYAGPTGSSAVFYPASQNVTVNNANITNENFSVNLGYTVSGTVAYSGAQTVSQAKPIYLSLNPINCGTGGGALGTSISAAGAYTIRGVPPNSYTLQAFQDPLGFGSTNTLDPTGNSSVTVNTANVTGANVTLADPGATTLASAPKLQGGGGFANGALIAYKGIKNSNGEEMATSYTLQWSTTSTFTTVAGSKTFPANGNKTEVWLLNSASSPTLTNGGTFYFRAYGTSAGTSQSAFSSVLGPLTLAAPSGGNTVSGSVTFTGTATGPLYVGFFDLSQSIFYGEYFASPTSAQAYTVQVPTGSDYVFAVIIDQNNNGLIDAGDISNLVGNGGNVTTAISGATPNENLTLPSGNATATVTTQNFQSTNSNGNSQNYSLDFQVRNQVKQPVAVTLSTNANTDGANSVAPLDIALCTNNCGQGFQYTVNIAGTSPAVNDTYTFAITYSDATTSNITATVTAVLTAFATNLSPAVTSSSLTPTFSWTDPANASNYTYQFYLNPNSGGNTIWQIPGNNSNSNGLTSATTSLVYGTDPTNSQNTPTQSNLTSGASYNWQITVQDSNGNQATQQTYFVAP